MAIDGIASRSLISHVGSGASGPRSVLTSPLPLNSHSHTPIVATLAVT